MSQSQNGPVRRESDLDVRVIGDEAIAYDLTTDEVMHLDARATAVFQAFDGSADVADLAQTTKLTPAEVASALVALEDVKLVSTGMSRRQLLRVGGTAAAVGGIVLLTASPAAAACSTQTATLAFTSGSCVAATHNRNLSVDISNFSTVASGGPITFTVSGTPDPATLMGNTTFSPTSDCAATTGTVVAEVKKTTDVTVTATQGSGPTLKTASATHSVTNC